MTTIPIGFTAALSHSINFFTSGQAVLYDHVFTNVGSGYDASTGKFTAPIHGIYNFFFKTLVIGNFELNLDLVVVNGTAIVMAESYGTSTRDGTGSASCAIELKPGDTVFIRPRQNHASHANARDWNTFSGFLVTKL